MRFNIKKLFIAATLISASCFSQAFGDDQFLSYSEAGNCCATPCAPTSCGTGFISAGLLYWRAYENGLDFCDPSEATDNTTSSGNVFSRTVGKGREPNFRWKPGFRIAAGYGFARSDWEIGASWTHFESKTNGSHHGNELRWNVKLDVVDVALGYDCQFNSCFNLRPFIGVRGAWIDQKLRNNHFSRLSSCSENNTSVSDDFFVFKSNNKQDFSGAGPLIGLGADFDIGCGFSFYANGSVAFLYGKFAIRNSEFSETIDTFSCCRLKKHLDANFAAADAGIGIRWQKCLCDNMRLILQLGLEHHRYFDFNRLGGCCGDLSFDGMNLTAAITY